MPRNRRADELLLKALACGSSVESAAQAAGVSVSTVRRRLRTAAFRKKLQALKADITERAAALLAAASGEEAKTLVSLLKDPAPAAVRLRAALAG